MTGRTLRRIAAAGLLTAVAALVLAPGAALADPAPSPGPTGGKAFTLDDDRIEESSGLAASSVHKGTYYTVNDSDNQAYVYAVDGKTGEVQAALRFRQVENRDWEAIASGPEGRVWIGDIGDNDRNQPRVTLYRFREPEQLEDQRMRYVRYRLEYRDGSHDAEALLVHPKTGRVYVVTKSLTSAGIYVAPEELSEDEDNELSKLASAPAAITDGAFTPDGKHMILRTYHEAYVYTWGTKPKMDRKIALPAQPQGESLAVSADGKQLLVGSEGEGSQVYALSLAAATAQPTPTSSKSASAQPSAGAKGEAKADSGTDKSLLAGVPWWVPVLVLVVALAAAVAAFPARRTPARVSARSGPPPGPAPVPADDRDPFYNDAPPAPAARPLYRDDLPPAAPPPVPPAPVGRPLFRDEYEEADRRYVYEPEPPREEAWPPAPGPASSRPRRPLFRDEQDDEPPLPDPYRQPDPYARPADPYDRDPYRREPDPYRVEPPVRDPYSRQDDPDPYDYERDRYRREDYPPESYR